MDNNDLVSDKDFFIKPDATAAEIDELLKTADSEVKKAIALHPNTSPETLIELCKHDPNDYLYINYCDYVLDNPVLSLILLESPNFLDKLYDESFVFLGHSAKLPEAIVDWAVNHSCSSIRGQIAANQYIPIECLEKLAQDLYTEVRNSLAQTVCMSDKDFEWLYKKKAIDRTVNLYRDRALKIIYQLAGDKDKNVRYVVAKNTGTPISILEQLSFDSDLQVLSAVAGNSQTPQPVIRRLFESYLQSLSEYKPVAKSIAMNRNTPVDLMERFASSENNLLRYLIAGNSSATKKILTKLARDRDIDVRIQVASNPNTSPETIEYLEREGIMKSEIPF